MSGPLVSVVIPCFNRAHMLRGTIDSVLEQDWPQVECIVVDAASKDGTVEILRSYGDRIRWVSEPDRGHADAINKGWKMSRGEILAWLNADDRWAGPHTARTAVEFLRDHPDVDVVYGDIRWIDRDGNPMGGFRPIEWDTERAVRGSDHIIPQPAAFLRRSIVERIGWLDPGFHFMKDMDLWLRCALRGKLRHVPVVLAHEYAGPGTWAARGYGYGDAYAEALRRAFAAPEMPEALRRHRGQAMASARLRGVYYCILHGRHWRAALRYLHAALASDRASLWEIFRGRWVRFRARDRWLSLARWFWTAGLEHLRVRWKGGSR